MIEELDQLDEGIVLDMITESMNDSVAEEYQELATQADFDRF